MKNKTKNRKNRYQRSDIPYADRLLIERYDTVANHRNDAAATALKLACVALNETEGLGFVRLCRFARELRGLINEYYSDIEVGEAHLNERLASMGFIIMEGKLMVPVQKAEGQPEEAVISGERFEEAE